MKFNDLKLTAKEKVILDGFDYKYCIVSNRKGKVAQTVCEVTENGVIFHAVAYLKNTGSEELQLEYTFQEFFKAVEERKIQRGIA